jgi:SAM-dependent methyltransferase
MLAVHFPMSKATLSDYLPAVLDGQRKAVADLKLQDRSIIHPCMLDLVTCSLGLHSIIPDGPVGSLREIERALRPGGRLGASL